MISKQVGYVVPRSGLLKSNHIPAANTAAVVTLPAAARVQHFLHGVQWSYSTSPTGGKLTITVNAVIVWEVDITGSGPGGYNFGIAGGTNQAVVVTLASGTGACVGKLNVQFTSESEDSK